jgi:hypothetical protein
MAFRWTDGGDAIAARSAKKEGAVMKDWTPSYFEQAYFRVTGRR